MRWMCSSRGAQLRCRTILPTPATLPAPTETRPLRRSIERSSAMNFLRVAALAALLALVLADPARAAIDDAGCVDSLYYAFGSYQCGSSYDRGYKYTCPTEECKKEFMLVAQPCLAEGYRLADQVASKDGRSADRL